MILPGKDYPTAQRGRLRREGTDCEHSLRGGAQVHPSSRFRGLSQPGERGPPRGHSHSRGDAAPQLRVGPPAGQLLGQAGLGRRYEPRGAVEPRAMAHQGGFQVPAASREFSIICKIVELPINTVTSLCVGQCWLRIGFNADPCGSGFVSGSWLDFKVTTVESLPEKYITKVQKSFLKVGLLAYFGQFPCSWIRIRLPYTDPDPNRIEDSQN